MHGETVKFKSSCYFRASITYQVRKEVLDPPGILRSVDSEFFTDFSRQRVASTFGGLQLQGAFTRQN